MKAIHEHTRNPSTDHHLTRRAALHGAASVGAAVLPAGAAMAAPAASSGLFEHFVQTWMDNPEAFRRFAGIAPSGPDDPLIAMWQEREEARRAGAASDAQINEALSIDGDSELVGEMEDAAGPIWDRKWAAERSIAETPPTSPEGVAIIAAVVVGLLNEAVFSVDELEVEGVAAVTLSRYILANTPADVLRRAGLEG